MTQADSLYVIPYAATDTVDDGLTEWVEPSYVACYDSVLAPYRDLPVVRRKSMFAGSVQHRDVVAPQERPVAQQYDWVFGIVILLLATISLYMNRHKFTLKELLTTLFDKRVLFRVFRDNNLKPYSLLPIAIVYLAGIALLVVHGVTRFSAEQFMLSEMVQYLLLLAGLLLFFFIKNSLIGLLGSIFEEVSNARLYVTNTYLFYFVGGLLTVPFMLLMTYNEALSLGTMYAYVGLIAILFIVRMIRGMQLILSSSNSSKLYLFYYLCIFEIVPILVTTKVLIY